MTKTIKRKNNYTARNKKKQIKISAINTLKKVQGNVAGIDVGSEFHFVAAPDPKHSGKIAVNRFGSFTSNLKECVNWLKQCGVTSVAMEATGVYWTVLYEMLVDAGIEVLVVNPRDFKKMKDKKTDVCDAEYLQLYHSYGLFEGSIIPENKIAELRQYVRLREQSVSSAAASIQRLQKALVSMNLRLDNVLSDLSGETGMRIIRAILQGEHDPKKLATYRDKRCQKTEEEIEESLNGHYRDHYLFALDRAVREYDYHMQEMRKCDEQIEATLKTFAAHQNWVDDAEDKLEKSSKSQKTNKKSQKTNKKRSHEFLFDLRKEIIRITGVDLTLLAGIGEHTALTLISETGLDMTRWKSDKHFSSWLKLAANNKVSGGKVLKRRTKQKKPKAAITFRMAVSGLYSEANDTALGAFYRRKRAQIGSSKAITAAANKLAKMYYMTLLTGKPFIEMGATKYLELQKDKYLRRVRRTIEPWGLKIVESEERNEVLTPA